MDWSPGVYLATAILPEVLTGGYLCTILASYSFIADNSTPETRMLRLAVKSFSHYIGSPIGIPLGSVLYSTGGYTLVFAVKAVMNIVALAYVLLRLWNFEENVIRMKKQRIADGEDVVSGTN